MVSESDLRIKLISVNKELLQLRDAIAKYESLINMRIDITHQLKKMMLFGENDDLNYLFGKYIISLYEEDGAIYVQKVEQCDRTERTVTVSGQAYTITKDSIENRYSTKIVYEFDYIDFGVISGDEFNYQIKTPNNGFETLYKHIENF